MGLASLAQILYLNPNTIDSPAAEVGNPASLDKFFSLLITLLDICNNIGGCGVLTLGQLKIFKMAAAKRGKFVMEMFICGR